jgi:hypothetical protein
MQSFALIPSSINPPGLWPGGYILGGVTFGSYAAEGNVVLL